MESTESDVAQQEQTNSRAPPLQHMEDRYAMIAAVWRPLGLFMNSGLLDIGPTLYMPYDAFWSAYKMFCKKRNLPPPNACATRYDNITYKLDLSFIGGDRPMMYPRNGKGKGRILKTTWVLGVDLSAKPPQQ